jgi:hypothetical protein
MLQQPTVAVGVHIDKARGHDAARGIDRTSGFSGAQVANCRDAVAADTDISSISQPPAAVDYVTTADHDVEHWDLTGFGQAAPHQCSLGIRMSESASCLCYNQRPAVSPHL